METEQRILPGVDKTVEMVYNTLKSSGRVGKRKLFYNTLVELGYDKRVAYDACGKYCKFVQLPFATTMVTHVADLVNSFINKESKGE